MALTKYKIGDLITLIDERNTEGIREFYGININKEFMPTVANTDGLDEKSIRWYEKIVLYIAGCRPDAMSVFA